MPGVPLPPCRPTSPAHGIDLPVYWGNRNWDPLPPRHARDDGRRRGTAGGRVRDQRVLVVLRLPAVPREPLRRGRGARPRRRASTSCGTTSTTRVSSRRTPTRCLRASESLSGRRAGRRAAGLRHPLDPHRPWPRAPVRSAAPTWRSTAAPPAWSPRACARRPDSSLRVGPRLLQPVGLAADPVARARRQRPPRERCRRAASRRSCSCRSASSPTTWRSSTTSTPRPPTRRGGSGCRSGAPRRPGSIRRSSAAVRDLLLERAAAERGEPVTPGRAGRARVRLGRLRAPPAAPTREAPRPALCEAAGRSPRWPS